jgi:hypothetical protein
MSISASIVQRDAGGCFLPGQSGNPLGKAPGTRNRATRLRQIIEDGEDRIIGRVLIDKAKAGDAVAARFVIGHLMPRPRGRAIELDLPEGTWAGDIVATFNATMMAMASGEITPDEALTITWTFDGRLKALKAWEMERWLTRYEKIPGDTAFEEQKEEEAEEEVYEDEEEVGDEEPAPAAAPTEPSPSGPFDKCSGGPGEGVAPVNALHPGESAPPAPLHSACIQPSPATIAGRRRVAEQAMRQWVRTMPR